MSTKLIFRYSYIYEETLARLTGERFEYPDFEKSQKFVEEYQIFWNKINDKVFDFYKTLGLVLPEFWIGYAINERKELTPFSDPLTFFISDDFEKTTAIVIHELCHVFLIYGGNIKISNDLWEEVSKKYPNENFNTIAHLQVNLLAKAGVQHIFGSEKTNELLKPEREMNGLKEAWTIIDSKKEVLEEMDPIKAIHNL
ncbi:MAG: hypothetical protein WA051_01935 [Minisyncoccia bacterium]